MNSEARHFYNLQYKWKRMKHPSLRAAIDKKHPLYHVELAIQHHEHIVYNLISDVLGKTKVFQIDDVAKLGKTFSDICSEVDSMRPNQLNDEYKDYISQILDLLKSATKVLQENS
jgi:hypoxanthine phosphoribosyltransferase